MIYISGKPHAASNHPPLNDAAALVRARAVQVASVYNWLPKHRRDALLDRCYEVVKRANTPPVDEPFLADDGRAYSDPGQFADDLVHEFREQLYKLLGARGDGPYFTLEDGS